MQMVRHRNGTARLGKDPKGFSWGRRKAKAGCSNRVGPTLSIDRRTNPCGTWLHSSLALLSLRPGRAVAFADLLFQTLFDFVVLFF